MPFDASAAIPVSTRYSLPAAQPVCGAGDLAAGDLAAPAPQRKSAETPAPASIPFYSAAYPRPVAAIAPRLARGVL